MSQQNIRDGFDDGMEQILLISGKANFTWARIQLARNANLAIIAQG
jgi:hypothetical protein